MCVCVYICIYIFMYILLQSPSSKVLNSVNRTIYIYFGFVAKETIIGHYTLFYGLIPIVKWLQFI